MLSDCLVAPAEAGDAVPIRLVEGDRDIGSIEGLDDAQRAFAAATGFRPKAGRTTLLPDGEGRLACVLFGLGGRDDADRTLFLPGKLAETLPPGLYRFADAPDEPALAAVAFALGGYRFDAYRSTPGNGPVRLVVPDGVDADDVRRIVDAVALARTLVNMPANDMGPEELERSARDVAARFGADIGCIVGDELEARGFPLIHAVGRASTRAPRLVDLTWGDPAAPKVTLVGKGVCFDTGGLDIKPSSGMLLMKKDMGGAAAVLALAAMVMSAGLPVRLRVLVPAVENAISGSAFRPGDVLRSRAGIHVGIGNTDAEGRLVLADALALAAEEKPALIVDMATLTGAARVALGPDLPPFYTRDDRLADEISEASTRTADPLWRLPLWRPYERLIESKVADIDNAGSGPFAGSITAALFLSRFVPKEIAWAHFDIYAWNPSSRPGRPEGGEAQGVRALYDLLRRRHPPQG